MENALLVCLTKGDKHVEHDICTRNDCIVGVIDRQFCEDVRGSHHQWKKGRERDLARSLSFIFAKNTQCIMERIYRKDGAKRMVIIGIGMIILGVVLVMKGSGN